MLAYQEGDIRILKRFEHNILAKRQGLCQNLGAHPDGNFLAVHRGQK